MNLCALKCIVSCCPMKKSITPKGYSDTCIWIESFFENLFGDVSTINFNCLLYYLDRNKSALSNEWNGTTLKRFFLSTVEKSNSRKKSSSEGLSASKSEPNGEGASICRSVSDTKLQCKDVAYNRKISVYDALDPIFVECDIRIDSRLGVVAFFRTVGRDSDYEIENWIAFLNITLSSIGEQQRTARIT